MNHQDGVNRIQAWILKNINISIGSEHVFIKLGLKPLENHVFLTSRDQRTHLQTTNALTSKRPFWDLKLGPLGVECWHTCKRKEPTYKILPSQNRLAFGSQTLLPNPPPFLRNIITSCTKIRKWTEAIRSAKLLRTNSLRCAHQLRWFHLSFPSSSHPVTGSHSGAIGSSRILLPL